MAGGTGSAFRVVGREPVFAIDLRGDLSLSGGAEAFVLPITQEELAGLVGASRERVNKAIASFLRLGWIEQNDRSYRILKRRELEIRSQ